MSNFTRVCGRTFVAALVGAVSVAVAGPDERPGLDPDFPVRMEDAYPVSFNDAYVKFVSRFTHNDDGTDTTSLQPEVAWGFAKNVDVHLSSSYLVGDGSRVGSGDLNLNVQWLPFPEVEGDWFPAVAVEGDLIVPTGVLSDGLDTIVQVNVTKTLLWKPTWDSVHLNLTWTHNAVPNQGQRDDGYNVILGYSRRILDDTTLVADVLWEKTLSDHTSDEIAEVGLIQELGEHVKLAGGIGVGFGDDAPDYTATIGIILSN